MESIINIFKQLGVDVTIWYQFVVFAILYPLLKYLFFSKLQFVLEHREGRTTKLESGANLKFSDAEKLSEEFDEKIKSATNEAQLYFNAEKTKAAEKISSDYKVKEKQILDVMDSEVEAFKSEIEKKKGAIIGQAANLSNSLVERLT